MKLLDISSNYLSDNPVDIAGIHVHRQNVELQKHGWDIRVINPQPFLYQHLKKRAHYYPYTSMRDSISIWRPRYVWLPLVAPSKVQERRYASALLRVVRGMFQDWQPDIVVCDWILPGGLGTTLIGEKHNLPIIFKAHGSDVRTIISSANSTRSCRECYKRLVNKARWVVCNGQGLYEDIKQAEIVAPDRLLSIPIGVDTRIFHELNFAERSLYRNNCGIPGQAVLWLFVGTWIDYKGTFDMAAVIPNLLARFKEVHFVVLGPIKDMKSRIQFEQLTGDIKHRIHFLGGVQPDKVAEWMQISDILLLPSYKEGLPSALLEAMATGVVPIASNVGGIPSVIHHGVNGFLLQPGDTDALEAALVSCTTDVALRRQLSRAAQATIQEQEYSLTAVGEKLHHLFLTTVQGI